MAADGSIIIETRLDNAKAEKELDKLTKKIEAAETKLASKTAERNQIAEQLREANKEAIEAYNNVERLQNALKRSQVITSVSGPNVDPIRYSEELEKQKRIKEELKAQEKVLRQKEAVAERLATKDAAAVAKLEQQTAELKRQKADAADVADQIDRAKGLSGRMSDAMGEVTKRIDKLGTRISKFASRVFVFTLITSALRSMRTWLGKVIQTNDEASSAMARLKGALLTLAQPLVNVIIPAFTALVNILTRVVTAIANLISLLFGKTIDQSKAAASALNSEMEALEGVGSAAKDAAGSLAGFDEINQLAGETASGSGVASGVGVDFDFDTSTMEADFEKLLNWIKLIGAALLAWKLSDSFLGGLRMFAGLILAINGAIELAKGTWDAWQNGVDWDNFLQMLQGAALLVAGLAIAFGKLGAGIGLVVSGLTMLVTGFHDAMENGWNLQNTLMTIAGIMATGLGISLLTGSYIPALIAAIASLLLALTVATGHGEDLIEGIRTILEGFKEFFIGIFSGDIEKAIGGICKIFEGLKTAAGAVIAGIRDTFLGFLDWLDEKTGGKFHGIIETAKGFVTGFFDSVITTLGNILDGVQQYFTGIVQFIAGIFTNDWDLAWEGIKNIFKGFWNQNIALFEGAVNLIIKGLNWLIKQMNKIGFEVPDWVPSVGGKSIGINIPSINEVSIPRLATGAVIPRSREFMAILGDNKKETEVVSPLSTMKQALLEALQEAGGYGDGTITVVVNLDGREVARNTVKHINSMTQQAGKPVLLI